MLRRTELKRGAKQLKRTPLKRRVKTEEEIAEDKAEQEALWHFFDFLWGNLPAIKKCWNCGTVIYGENLTIYWDHLLEKNKYEELKYEPGNLFFCCADCHTNKGNGFPGDNHRKAIEIAERKFLD